MYLWPHVEKQQVTAKCTQNYMCFLGMVLFPTSMECLLLLLSECFMFLTQEGLFVMAVICRQAGKISRRKIYLIA